MRLRPFSVLVGVGVFVGMVGVSCGRADRSAPSVTGDSFGLRLTEVARIDRPVAFAVRPGDRSDVVYVAGQDGIVHAVDTSTGAVSTVADLRDRTIADGERGLLGIAFSDDGDEMYAHYSDAAGDTRVVAIPWREGRAMSSESRVLLAVDQPHPNHNGGQLVVDGAGNLLIGLGDGGGTGDPAENAENPDSLLGKILRIDPEPAPGSSMPYAIPVDNPFVGQSGARPEILHLGLRNPWRFSFDRDTGDLWIGDVGQNAWEEIDVAPAGSIGLDFGWDRREGRHDFEGGASMAVVDPVWELRNDGGAGSIGGYVYRGSRIPALQGAYVFGDLSTPGIRLLLLRGDSVTGERAVDLPVTSVVSFGEDSTGELFVLSYEGVVYRIDPA